MTSHRGRAAGLGLMARTVVPVAASLGLVAIATAALFAGRSILPLVNLVSIVYLLPVLFAATRWGLLPALVCAFAGAAAADYLFYPPIYSFAIGDTQNIADLAVFLIIAFVTSHYMARLRRRSESLARSRRELRSLYAFSCQLAACFTVPDLVAATGNYLSETLGHRTVLVGPDDEAPAAEPVPDHVWREAVAAATAGAGATRTIHDPATRQDWLVRAVSIGSADRAAIVELGRDSHEDLDAVIRRVDAAISEAAVTLARLDVAKAIEEAHLKSQAELAARRADRNGDARIAHAARLDHRLDQRARPDSVGEEKPSRPRAGGGGARAGEPARRRHPEPAQCGAHHRAQHPAAARVDRPDRHRERGGPRRNRSGSPGIASSTRSVPIFRWSR